MEAHINMRLSTKQLISYALVNIAAAICVQWWPGEEISIWSKQTMWNNNVSCDQEEPPSCLKHWHRIYPSNTRARITFLSLFVEAFTKIPHWKFVCFSQFDWLVGIGHLLEGRIGKKQNRREVGWAGRQAGTGSETTADQMESSRCHAREKQVWRSRLRLRVQTSEAVDLQNEQYRNCWWSGLRCTVNVHDQGFRERYFP